MPTPNSSAETDAETQFSEVKWSTTSTLNVVCRQLLVQTRVKVSLKRAATLSYDARTWSSTKPAVCSDESSVKTTGASQS